MKMCFGRLNSYFQFSKRSKDLQKCHCWMWMKPGGRRPAAGGKAQRKPHQHKSGGQLVRAGAESQGLKRSTTETGNGRRPKGQEKQTALLSQQLNTAKPAYLRWLCAAAGKRLQAQHGSQPVGEAKEKKRNDKVGETRKISLTFPFSVCRRFVQSMAGRDDLCA